MRYCRLAYLRYGLIAWLYLAIIGIATAAPYHQKSKAFGSFVEITIADDIPPQKANKVIDKILQRFYGMEKRFYAWDDNTELARLNQAIANQTLPIKTSPEMADLLNLASNYYEQTNHLFNPAIGRLIDLWGFYATPVATQPPSKKAITQWLQQQVGMTQIIIRHQTITAAPATIKIDFGAMLKGVAADDARDILKQAGIKNALVNVGGSLLAIGQNNNRPWLIALHKNREQPPIGIVNLYDGEAVSTSGDSEIYFIYNGQRYHHILDPTTGYPATNVQTAIVISKHSKHGGAISDAVATALVISDKATTQKIIARFDNLLVWQLGEKNYISPALKARQNHLIN